jgi:hypothetical protein
LPTTNPEPNPTANIIAPHATNAAIGVRSRFIRLLLDCWFRPELNNSSWAGDAGGKACAGTPVTGRAPAALAVPLGRGFVAGTAQGVEAGSTDGSASIGVDVVGPCGAQTL